MKLLTLLVALLFSFQLANAQNIVPNADFENYSSLPSSVAQVNLCIGWDDLNGGGSPDYLHELAGGSVNLPNSVFATVNPQSGSAVIGFAAYHGSNSNFREYISTTFSTPMVSGTTYNVSFWLTNGISGQCYGHSADGIGVRFSTSALTQLGTDPVGGTPHWEVPGEVWATSWQQFSFTFTADDNYTHITIGNFYDDANTSNSFQVSSNFSGAYYFIDNIEVMEAAPQMQVSEDTTICLGDSAILTVSDDAPYAWAESSAPSTIISTDSVLMVSPTTTTTYFVYGNSDTGSVTVFVINPPIVDLGNDTSLCQGEMLVLDATFPGASYLWQDGSMDSTFVASTTGTYWVEVQNACGTATDSIDIDILPGPSVDLGPDVALCEGETLTLDATYPGATYSWQDGSSNATFEVNEPGVYWVTVSIDCGTDWDTINVDYHFLHTVNIGNDTTICEGGVLLLDAETPEALSYEWQDGSTLSSLAVSTGGVFWVEVTDTCGIIADIIIVEQQTVPIADLGNDTTLCDRDTLSLSSGVGDIFTWQDGSSDPMFSPEESGEFWVTIENHCGQDSDTILVDFETCECYLDIPNAFSPNLDGINDEFMPIFECEFIEYSFIIYNRWGEKVFETNDSFIFWDGKLNNKDVPISSYVYVVNYIFENGVAGSKSGGVTLVR